jgi:hypothetical protein
MKGERGWAETAAFNEIAAINEGSEATLSALLP